MYKMDDEAIKSAVKILDNLPERDKIAANQSRMEYINQISQVADIQPGWIGQVTVSLNRLIGTRERKVSMSFVSIVLAVVLFIGAGGGTVYAAQTAMPDELLYPLKLVSEDVLVGITSAPEARVNLLQYYANRRIEEISREILDGDVPDSAIQERLQDQLRLMDKTLDQVGDQDQLRLKDQTRDMLRQHDQIITVLSQYSDDEQKQALEDAQNQVHNHLRNLGAEVPNPQLIRERNENTQPTQMEMTPQANRFGQPTEVPQPGQTNTAEPQGYGPQGYQYGLTITPTGTVTNNYQYQYQYQNQYQLTSGTETEPVQNQSGEPQGNGTQDPGKK